MASVKHWFALDSRVDVLRHKRDRTFQTRVFVGRKAWAERPYYFTEGVVHDDVIRETFGEEPTEKLAARIAIAKVHGPYPREVRLFEEPVGSFAKTARCKGRATRRRRNDFVVR